MSKNKNELNADYKRFFEEFYSHFMKNMTDNGIITKASIKKAISDFALSRNMMFEIRMKRQYRKLLEKQLRDEIRKQKELQKEQKKRNLIEGLI